MYDVEGLIEQIPDVCRELEDCWVSALIVVSIMRKKNYEPLFLNSYMYYDHSLRYEQLTGFEKIIRKNIAIAEADRHDFEEDVEIECEFLKEFIGLDCTGKQAEGEEARKYAKKMIKKGATCILWLDTYRIPWNPMYERIHFQHCATIVSYGDQECLVYDALNSDCECFSVPTKDLFEMTNYVSSIQDFKSKIQKNKSQTMVPYFVEKYMYQYHGIDKYISTIRAFLRDLKNCSKNDVEDMEEQNEDILKLMMRIFVNQYQKGTKQYEFFVNSPNVPKDILLSFEELNNTWKSCGSLFAKICFLPKEKRIKKYEGLYEKLSAIITELERIRKHKEIIMTESV